jgi:hypothetical protein
MRSSDYNQTIRDLSLTFTTHSVSVVTPSQTKEKTEKPAKKRGRPPTKDKKVRKTKLIKKISS